MNEDLDNIARFPVLEERIPTLADQFMQTEKRVLKNLRRLDIGRVLEFVRAVMIYGENKPNTNTKIADEELEDFCNELFSLCCK